MIHIQCMNILNINPCYQNSKATNYDENYTRFEYLPLYACPLANDLDTDYYKKKIKKKIANRSTNFTQNKQSGLFKVLTN